MQQINYDASKANSMGLPTLIIPSQRYKKKKECYMQTDWPISTLNKGRLHLHKHKCVIKTFWVVNWWKPNDFWKAMLCCQSWPCYKKRQKIWVKSWYLDDYSYVACILTITPMSHVCWNPTHWSHISTIHTQFPNNDVIIWLNI